MLRLKNFSERPWYLRMAVMVGAALLLYLAFWYFVTRDTRAEVARVEEEVRTLEGQNTMAQIASQRLTEFKARLARMQVDYDDLMALLPEQRELSNVLQGIQSRARGKLEVRRFAPKDDYQQDYLTAKPIEVEVFGNYNNLGDFFEQMASYERIVSITDFRVDSNADLKLKGGTIAAQFRLITYYVSAEKLQPPAEAKPGTVAAPAVAPTP